MENSWIQMASRAITYLQMVATQCLGSELSLHWGQALPAAAQRACGGWDSLNLKCVFFVLSSI